MKLHWFGPETPPFDAESEAAWTRTRSVLGRLAGQHEVRLWLREGDAAACGLSSLPVEHYPSEGQWSRLNDGGLAVYELADLPTLYLGSYGTLRVHRGVALVWGWSLDGLVSDWHRRTDSLESLRRLRESSGPWGRLARRRLARGTRGLGSRSSLLAHVARLSLGLAVEDDAFFRRLRLTYDRPLVQLDRAHESLESIRIRLEALCRAVCRRSPSTALRSILSDRPRWLPTSGAGAEVIQEATRPWRGGEQC